MKSNIDCQVTRCRPDLCNEFNIVPMLNLLLKRVEASTLFLFHRQWLSQKPNFIIIIIFIFAWFRTKHGSAEEGTEGIQMKKNNGSCVCGVFSWENENRKTEWVWGMLWTQQTLYRSFSWTIYPRRNGDPYFVRGPNAFKFFMLKQVVFLGDHKPENSTIQG